MKRNSIKSISGTYYFFGVYFVAAFPIFSPLPPLSVCDLVPVPGLHHSEDNPRREGGGSAEGEQGETEQQGLSALSAARTNSSARWSATNS